MAFTDYGAIAFKNGKCIQNDFFGDMREMVGWSDAEDSNSMSGNYFAFVGDKDLTVAFYKCYARVHCPEDGEDFYVLPDDGYIGWKRYEKYIGGNEITIINKKHGEYEFQMKYKGDYYRVVYGYGVDLPYYTRTGKFNYYKSVCFLMSKLFREVKNKIYDIRHGF